MRAKRLRKYLRHEVVVVYAKRLIHVLHGASEQRFRSHTVFRPTVRFKPMPIGDVDDIVNAAQVIGQSASCPSCGRMRCACATTVQLRQHCPLLRCVLPTIDVPWA